MGRFVFNSSKQGTGITVYPVDAELVGSGGLWSWWKICLWLTAFSLIKSIGMIIKPHAIAQLELISGTGYFAQLQDDIMHMVLHG